MTFAISRRNFLSATAGAALPPVEDNGPSTLANELHNRRKERRQLFDWKIAARLRPTLLKSRPRLAGDPAFWRLRARVIPETL